MDTASNNDDQKSDSGIVEMEDHDSVRHKIAKMYADQLMSDICLVVGHKTYPAHRVILGASSEVFQVMLMNPEWNECREKVIELKEEPLCSAVFPQFLKYLYVGQIKISLQTVMPMLALADKYNIKDLVQLCVDYMLKHISKAATQGFLVSWLHYTISLSPYHQEVTEALQTFLKWNLDIIAECKDFLNIDINILIILLQQNDLVLKNEYDLFRYTESWLHHKIDQITNAHENGMNNLDIPQLIENVIVHIRFAMMTPGELAKLLLRPIIQHHPSFFVERMSIGMSYHSGQEDRVKLIRSSKLGALQFTPRLYTSDTYALNMPIQNFKDIEDYHSFGFCFFSQSNLSEFQEDQNMQWNIDFFPRGIKYGRAKLINVYNMQTGIEVPELVLRTIRLRVTCERDLENEQRFKVGVVITGIQNTIHHVRTVHVKTHYFSKASRVINLDNLLPYDELALSSIKLRPHLIGSDRNELQLQVIIEPMGPYVCHDTPPFEFT